MTAVILAGGYGSRMGDRCRDLPKPMLCVAGKPILQRQIEALSREGIDDFIIVVGYRHEKITDFFGNGSRFGVKIRYYVEAQPMGTGGALKKLALKSDFLLLNGDLLFDISLQPFADFHFSKSAFITVYAHPNRHPFDSVLLSCDRNTDRVLSCGRNTQEDDYPNLCNAGIQLVSPAALDAVEEKAYMSFDRDILFPNIQEKRVYAYQYSECIFDVGTPERLEAAESVLLSGLMEKKRRGAPQKAVFLDRDGTINEYRGYIGKREDVALIPGAAQAINQFHALGYLVIVVTNQPVVARGECSEEELQRIHHRMEMLLGAEGAFVDDIFFCPHHPDAGFSGENKKYKVRCDCRKPAPGLILKAKARYHIDLSRSYMVGDSQTDVETACNAGCTPVYLRNERQAEYTPQNTMIFNDLSEFSEFLKE